MVGIQILVKAGHGALCTFIFGLCIYLPVQYLIYEPYFNIDWKKSQCLVENIQSYQLVSSYDSKTQQPIYGKYSLINVLVQIDGVMRSAFTCGSTKSTRSAGSSGFNNKYPYQYGECPLPTECDKQLIQPMWYCSECNTCQHLIQEEKQDCWWYLKDDQGLLDGVNDLPIGYSLEFPVESSIFIQASFREQPYYNEGEYLSLQIVVLWIFIAFGGFSCICMYCTVFILKRRLINA